MPDYRFVLLDADHSVQQDCIMHAETDDEAREIARGLLPELSVEVWKDSARIHFASRPNPLAKTDRDRDTTGTDNDQEVSSRYRDRADELRVLAARVDDERTREALLIVAGHYDSMAQWVKT